MKSIKILSSLVALILVLVIGVAVYFYLNLNTIVKRAVEEVGPQLTQTPVVLDAVDISLTDGRSTLSGFSISNPPGFSSEHAFTLDEFNFELDPASLYEDVIVIKDITIGGINITLEQKGTSTNLQEIKKAIDAWLPTGSAEDDSASNTSTKNIMVEKVTFNAGKIQLITEKYGEKSLSLPKFEQRHIGNKETGITPEQLAKQLLNTLTKKAKSAAEKELKSALSDEVKDKAKEKLKDKLEGLLKR